MRTRLGAAAAFLLAACGVLPGSSPTPVGPPLPVVELKYRVMEQVGRPWYCDPDFYPIARADEIDLARQRLPEMQADPDYQAILRHNNVPPGAPLLDAELLAVYHDWKDLQRIPLQPVSEGVYGFSLLVRPATPDKQGEQVDGRIHVSGSITIVHREQAPAPNCPICLASSTRVDTPSGPVLVTDLRIGDLVWTLDARGERVAAPILETGSIEAPAGHEVIRLALADGRAVTASPGHPLADGRPVGSLAVGDQVDGSAVVAVERLPYHGRTYDLLTAGATGVYWADGVLLRSTLGR